MDAAMYRITKLRRGMEASLGFRAARLPQDTMGVLELKYYILRRGVCVWKYKHVQWSFVGFPRQVTLSVPNGERPNTEDTTSGAAPTSQPDCAVRDIWS